MSDSTRAENPGYTPSEQTVGEAFRDIMEGLEGRVIVATFASNIARIQQVFDAAARRSGARSPSSAARWSRTSGSRPTSATSTYAPGPARAQGPHQGHRRTTSWCIATTGAQGEPMAGLARMANRDHRFVEIEPGDTVIVSASPIPGNEEYVGADDRQPVQERRQRLLPHIKRAHVSGHASQEELKLMLNLTRPKHFIPIHGEFRMLVQHGRLAAELGVAPENIFIIENGQPIEFLPDGTARRGTPRRGGLRLRRRPVGRARSATSSCATGARSPTTACSWSS